MTFENKIIYHNNIIANFIEKVTFTVKSKLQSFVIS